MEISKGKVLIVDDEKSVLDLFTKALSKEDYVCDTVTSGEDALKRIEKDVPDVVLLDIALPGMDGIEVLEKIKSKHKDLPVIMITAYGYKDDLVEKAISKGAAGYIGKSQPLSEIIHTFKWMSEKAIRQEPRQKNEIIIIDDEPDVCKVIGDFLKKERYKAVSATGALEGIEIVKRDKPEVVLLDIIMPELNGVEALRRIREFDKGVKIIMLTGVNDEETAKQAVNMGANDYVTKPVTLEHLLSKIISNI